MLLGSPFKDLCVDMTYKFNSDIIILLYVFGKEHVAKRATADEPLDPVLLLYHDSVEF